MPPCAAWAISTPASTAEHPAGEAGWSLGNDYSVSTHIRVKSHRTRSANRILLRRLRRRGQRLLLLLSLLLLRRGVLFGFALRLGLEIGRRFEVSLGHVDHDLHGPGIRTVHDFGLLPIQP